MSAKMTTFFLFLLKVQPIAYKRDAIGGNRTCVITGWGYTNPDRDGPNQQPNHMQTLNETTITNDECTAAGWRYIDDTDICVVSATGTGICEVSQKKLYLLFIRYDFYI